MSTHRTSFRNRACSSAALLATFATTAASAQVLEEVTVSAQRREQNSQDVGISVAAVAGESLRDLGLTDTVEAVSKVPNALTVSIYGPGSSAAMMIRGIGQSDFGEGHEAPVTTYVDDFYLASVPAAGFSMFDLSRMEVLRGPQGTLFGRNSTGGLVHFMTAKPTERPEGFLQLSGGRFGEYKAEGAISGALTEQLLGRLSVLSHHSDGWMRNVNPRLRPAGQAGTDAVRAQLRWLGDSGWDVLFKAEYGELDSRHSYYSQVPVIKDPSNGGLFSRAPGGTDFAGYNEATFGGGVAADPTVSNSDRAAHLSSDSSTLLLRVEKDFGAVKFTSLSGYMDLSRKLIEDCDASPNPLCLPDFPYSTNEFTQELRLTGGTGSNRWTTGVYYLDSTAHNKPTSTFNIPISGPAAVDPNTGLYNGAYFPIALAADWVQDVTSYSGFGQVEHDFGKAFTLIAGIRATRDEKDFFDRDNASLRQCQSFPIPTNCFTNYTPQPYRGRYQETLYSGKLGVDWHPIADVLIYGSVSKGSKGGGFNNGFYPAGLSPAAIPYASESIIAYEMGAKSTLASGRVRLNIAAFHYDYGDYQAYNWSGIGGRVGNRDATSQGGELELEVQVTDSWGAALSVAGLDTNVKNVTLRDGVTVRDTEMGMAAHFSAAGNISYTRHVGASGSIALLWDFNYVGARWGNNFNDPASRLDAYFKHNARVAYSPNEHWELAAVVNNISDKMTVARTTVLDSLGLAQAIYSPPRTWHLQTAYHW